MVTQATYILAVGLCIVIFILQCYRTRRAQLHFIPAISSSRFVPYYVKALEFIWGSQNIIDDGYRKYKGRLFKIPMFDHWLVVGADIQFVEDIRKAPEDLLSFQQALFLFLQTDYTLGPQIRKNSYHTNLIRTGLARGLGALSNDIRDEMVVSFNEIFPVRDEWIKYNALNSLMRVVCRTSNRVFVGAPTCRNPDYEGISIRFTEEVLRAAVAIRAFPSFLKPVAALIFSNVHSYTRQCSKHLAPVVEQRRAQQEKLGANWSEKPNDMLMWCMEETPDERDIDQLSLRILLINFGAIHTTSMALTFAIHHLADNPHFVEPLREEIEMIPEEERWSKSGLNRMYKIDSFLKETLRVDPPGLWAMQRLSLKHFSFSNGDTIPPGTMVSCPVASIHQDEAYYKNAKAFDPWRFVANGEYNQLVSTHPEYLAFGHGKFACPGRFFAAMELKMMLAHLVLNYDVKFEDGQTKPPNVYIASACMPGKGDVMIKRRFH